MKGAEPRNESWSRGIADLGRWAEELGVPVAPGSPALLAHALREAGGGDLPVEWQAILAAAEREGGAWVLRTSPGAGELLRRRIDADPALSADSGAPWIQVEESPWAWLPAISRSRWPSAEAWIHSASLLGDRVSAAQAFLPVSFEQLMAGPAKKLPSERALLEVWDRWALATAWEIDRSSFWLAGRAVRSGDPRTVRVWNRRAGEWGLRVWKACIERSGVVAKRVGPAVRLGLGEVAEMSAESAAALVEERRRGGPWSSPGAFFKRVRRVGVRRREIVALIRAGALSRFGRPGWELMARAWISYGTKRRAADSPFLPHTVIAHNPRPAALRCVPVE